MQFLAKRWVQITLLLLLLLAAVMLRLQDPPAIEQLRQLTFDHYNKLSPRKAHSDILIVDIDEESIQKYGQWPWPRTAVAELPVILKEMGAKAVVFDMVFSEPDRTSLDLVAARLPVHMASIAEELKKVPNNDIYFAQKIAETGNIVTGFTGANQPTPYSPTEKAKFLNEGIKPAAEKFIQSVSHFTVSLPPLNEAAAGSGSFAMFPQADGVIRRVPLIIGQRDKDGKVVEIYPSLALEALRVAEKKSVYTIKSYSTPHADGYGITEVKIGDYKIPTDKSGNIWVYYAGHRQQIYVSAWEVLARQIPPEQVKDKIVLIGTSASGLLDLRSSPLNSVLPGVEVHAEIIEQVLHGQFLQRPDFLNGAELIVIVIMSLFIIFLSPFVSTGILALMGAILIGGGAFFGGFYVYKASGIVLDPVYPTLAILTIFIMSSILTNLRIEFEKRAVRQAFNQYLSPVLIEELAREPEKLKLGGEVKDITVLFMDIRNFATICEGMDPAYMIKLMSDFLTPMTSCVLDNRGTVDKYMGDAMMAFWNAPLDDTEHSRNACIAALQMIEALGPVNENFKDTSEKAGRKFMELRAGIGIHRGRASVGNMGSKQRFAYSALGDAVNLGSRLEGQTKHYAVSIIISEATRQETLDFAAIELDILVVKGRAEKERIYALLGDSFMAENMNFKNFAQKHSKMLAAYRAKDWDEAEILCDACAAMRPDLTKLYAVYKARMEDFRKTLPTDDWKGVWVAKEK
jgi:adenylate cyclase